MPSSGSATFPMARGCPGLSPQAPIVGCGRSCWPGGACADPSRERLDPTFPQARGSPRRLPPSRVCCSDIPAGPGEPPTWPDQVTEARPDPPAPGSSRSSPGRQVRRVSRETKARGGRSGPDGRRAGRAPVGWGPARRWSPSTMPRPRRRGSAPPPTAKAPGARPHRHPGVRRRVCVGRRRARRAPPTPWTSLTFQVRGGASRCEGRPPPPLHPGPRRSGFPPGGPSSDRRGSR